MEINSPYVGAFEPFNLRVPRDIVFGSGASGLLVEKMTRLGAKKPLFMTGETMGKNKRMLTLMDSVRDAGMEPGHWDKITPEPPVERLQDAVSFIREGGYDALIAFGGGSTMDFTKMAAVLAKYPDHDVEEMIGIEKTPGRGLPTVMMPTTAGSGSEVASGAIFLFEKLGAKKGILSSHMIADIVLVDPALTLALPPGITASSGMDALIHGVESYLSKNASALSQELALSSIKWISKSLSNCVHDGSDLEAREGQAYGSLLAGMAFSMSGTCGVHALGHALGAQYHVPHGEACTALLRWVTEYNIEGCEENFTEVARAMGVYRDGMDARKAARTALDAMIKLSEDIGVKTRTREFGVPKEASKKLAQDAINETRLLGNNPRKMDEATICEIFDRAW